MTADARAVTASVLGGAVTGLAAGIHSRARSFRTPRLYYLDRGPSGSRVSVVAAALNQGEQHASSPEHNPGHAH